MKIKFVNVEISSIEENTEEQNIDRTLLKDLSYYYSRRKSFQELLLKEENGKLVLQGRFLTFEILKGLSIKKADAVLFYSSEVFLNDLIKANVISISSLEEFKKKEALEDSGWRMEVYFFDRKIEENLSDLFQQEVSRFYDSVAHLGKEIVCKDYSFNSELSCIELTSNYPNRVDDREYGVLYNQFLKKIKSKFALRSINGRSINL